GSRPPSRRGGSASRRISNSRRNSASTISKADPEVRDLGHDCMVVAPTLIPKRSGERVKTNRRDAVTLARLHRAGELTGVWVPDVVHEAVRDLVRAREAGAADLRRKRLQLLSFLLSHGRIFDGKS